MRGERLRPAWMRAVVRRTAVVVLVGLAAGSGGCRTWFLSRTDPWESPARAGPMLVESDLPLADDHPLLTELALQRERMGATLGLKLSDRPIHVRLLRDRSTYDRFVQRHFPNFPDRRAFFVEAEGRIAVYAYWGERMAEDLRHELAHGHLHAAVGQVPLWLDEGLAEFFEVPDDEYGFHAAHAARLAQRRRDGWRPDLRRLERFESAGQLTVDDYAEAWAWAHDLINGSPRGRQQLVAYLQLPSGNGPRPPLSRYLGDTSELERNMAEVRSRAL